MIFNLLVGIPGSGKSYYAQEYLKAHPNSVWLSSDAIREELLDDANDQQNPRAVFDEMFRRTITSLNNGKNVVYDATNLVAKTRRALVARIREAVKEDFSSCCHIISCTIEECKMRNANRDRVVPEEVIDRMVRQFQIPWYNEGWDQIVLVKSGSRFLINKEQEILSGIPHDNPHHSANLGEHCALAAAKMERILDKQDFPRDKHRAILLEAALRHDIGKRATKVFHNAKGERTNVAHYYEHNNVGAYLWLSSDQQFNWSFQEFLYIGLLIQWHMQPYFLAGGSYESLLSWCRRKGFNNEVAKDLWFIHEADLSAH